MTAPRVVALCWPSDRPFLRTLEGGVVARWTSDQSKAMRWDSGAEAVAWIEERLPGWLAEMEREAMPIRLLTEDVLERMHEAARRWPPDLQGFWSEGVDEAVIIRCRSCRWTLPLAKDNAARAWELLGVIFHGAEHQATAIEIPALPDGEGDR